MTPTVYDSTSTNTKDRKKETTSTPPLLLLRLRGCQNEHLLYDSSIRCGNALSLSLSEERRSLKAESSRARTHQLFCEKVCLHFSHS